MSLYGKNNHQGPPPYENSWKLVQLNFAKSLSYHIGSGSKFSLYCDMWCGNSLLLKSWDLSALTSLRRLTLPSWIQSFLEGVGPFLSDSILNMLIILTKFSTFVFHKTMIPSSRLKILSATLTLQRMSYISLTLK